MAKHRTSRRRPPPLTLLGTTAAGLSTALVFGHATGHPADTPQIDLAAATIGIGGRGDPTAANIPNKLDGNVVPPTFTYIPVEYPAGYAIDNSVAAGVPVLDQTIDQTVEDNPGQLVVVVGYSEGTLVAEEVRRDLDPADPGAPPTSQLLFVMIASPNVPNGGIFARFPNLTIPFIVTSNGPAQPSPYDTVYVTNEYDPYADFPAYFNVFSLANTLVAVYYVHPDQYYDSVDYDPLTGEGDTEVLVKTVTNSAGGTDTYVFVPADELPLLAPARDVAAATGTTVLTEPVLSAIEPVLRLLVDMGYTDRENLNPEVSVRFSLITPPERILQTAAAMPDAISQGANNFVTGVTAIPTSVNAPLAPTPAPMNSPWINAASAPQASYGNSVADDALAAPGPTDLSSALLPSGKTPPSGPPLMEDRRPTLGKLTTDGNKFTPNGLRGSTKPKRSGALLTQVTGAFTGLLDPNQSPPAASPPPSDTDAQSGAADS